MDSTLRGALLWSALPAAVLVGVGTAALLRPSLRRLTDGARKFSAGALFAVIAIELMPDLLFSHQFAAMAAFAFGAGLLIGVRWLTGRFGRADGRRAGRTPGLLAEAALGLLVSGALIGGGFVAGFREGLLLSLALTAEAVASGLVSAASLGSAGVSGGRVKVILSGLAALIVCGAIAGASLLWGRSGADFDVLFAFGLALLLLRALESLIDSDSQHSNTETLALFFAGLLLFLLLAGWLGGRHAEHPGRGGGGRHSRRALPGGEDGTFTRAFARFGQQEKTRARLRLHAAVPDR